MYFASFVFDHYHLCAKTLAPLAVSLLIVSRLVGTLFVHPILLFFGLNIKKSGLFFT